MSGHSKWAGIKHKKALVDARRGKLFSKLNKEITVAARSGGGDPEANPRLRTAIQKAKSANMPQDNIERAVKKGTGELPGLSYEEITYEGYGPGGVAVMVETATDNKNRTTAEVRNIFSKRGGNLAGSGSVSWIFQKKGLVIVDKNLIDEDSLTGVVLEAGGEDLSIEGETYHIVCDPKEFEAVKSALQNNGLSLQVAELTMIPKSVVKLEGSAAKQILGLVEELEDHDDIQNVYANFDIPDEVIEEE